MVAVLLAGVIALLLMRAVSSCRRIRALAHFATIRRSSRRPVPSAMALLEIQNVSRRFGDFTAVDQVSIGIEAGNSSPCSAPPGAARRRSCA